jgi:hypothetical protein
MPPELHSVLGASSAERWMNCPPSAKLVQGMEDETSPFAEEGSAAHALCEWKVRKALKQRAGKRPNSDYWTDEMEECSEAYRDFVMDIVGEARCHCSDVIGLVEQRVDFSCYVPEGFGTGDFLLVADGKLHVVDFKYGRGVPVYAGPKEGIGPGNPQMMLYALGALNLFECLYDVEQIAMTIYQPRLQNVSSYTISVDELKEWAEMELRPKAILASKGEGEYLPGSWCRFCKARNKCRARAESFLEMARYEFQSPPLLEDSEILEILSKADEIARWAAEVVAYAQAEAIENGKKWPGYKVVEGRSVRKFSSDTAVEEAAKNAGFNDIYNKSLITLTAFEKLMGKEKFQEVLGDFVVKPAGKLTLVPESDKRPGVTVANVKEEFED